MVTENGPALVSRVYFSLTEVCPVLKTKAIDKPKLDRREAFQAAASDLNATFVQGKRSSGDQIHLEHGPWKVVLDTYVVSNGQNDRHLYAGAGPVRSEGQFHSPRHTEEHLHPDRGALRLLRASGR